MVKHTYILLQDKQSYATHRRDVRTDAFALNFLICSSVFNAYIIGIPMTFDYISYSKCWVLNDLILALLYCCCISNLSKVCLDLATVFKSCIFLSEGLAAPIKEHVHRLNNSTKKDHFDAIV